MARAKTTDRARHVATPTVWVRVVAAFVAKVDSVGVAPDALLDAVGLGPEDLADPDARVSLETLYALLEKIVELSGEPLALLHITRDFELQALEALAFVVMTSPTFSAGLRAILRYQRLFADGERYELEQDPQWTRIVYVPWGPPRLAHALMAEMLALDILVNGATMTGVPFDRPRVELTHRPRVAVSEVAALLGGAQVDYERARNVVWIRTADLSRRIAPDGQASLSAYFAQQLEERIRALPASNLVATVRDMLVRASSVDPSVASIARRLKMSARTLQRRLADEGSSLRSMIDETRRARAIPLLERGHSIAEVAYALGYAEPSAFHRAFRRWTGRTPESFRRAKK